MALLTACGVSSISDIAPGAQSLGTGAPIQTASLDQSASSETSAEPSAQASPADGATVAKARETAAALTSVATPGNTAYKIGPFDVLEISVFKVPELSKTVQVSDAGTVNLPLVGETVAGGKTARDVEKELTQKLGAKYLQNPQVTIFVKEYNSKRVTLEGAVKKPGVFPIQGRLTLLQALATAQGLDPNSDSTVVVFREQDGKRAAARFDISDIRAGNTQDPELQAGDVVVAGTSAAKETFNTIIKALPFASVFALL